MRSIKLEEQSDERSVTHVCVTDASFLARGCISTGSSLCLDGCMYGKLYSLERERPRGTIAVFCLAGHKGAAFTLDILDPMAEIHRQTPGAQ